MKTPIQFRLTAREWAALRKHGRNHFPRMGVFATCKGIVQQYIQENGLLATSRSIKRERAQLPLSKADKKRWKKIIGANGL